MKKLTKVIACALVAVLMLTLFAACDWEGGGMQLTEEEWSAAFEAARKWENYNLNFRISLSRNYEIDEKHGIFNSGDYVLTQRMQFILDKANADGARMLSSIEISHVGEDGTWVDEGYTSYDAIEKGTLFGYWDRGTNYMFKSKAYLEEGETAIQGFNSRIETFDDYLPWFAFKADGKTLQLDELQSVLKYSKSSHEYQGRLGFELKPNGEEAEEQNALKTDSTLVSIGICNTKRNEENGGYERTNELPEDWSKWEGEIYVYFSFETEYEGETVLCTIELRYEWLHYPLSLPNYVYTERADSDEYDSHPNVLGELPSRNDD